MPTRPQRRQERDRRDPGRRGRRGGATSGPATSSACTSATPSATGWKLEVLVEPAVRHGRLPRRHVRGEGRRRVGRASSTRPVRTACSGCPSTESQGRVHTSAATVAVLPEAEEVDVDDRPQRPRDRRVPLERARRSVGEHHRLGGAHHAQADRPRRHLPGREEPAAEQGQGDAHPAQPAAAGRAGAPGGGAVVGAPRAR